MTRSPLILAPLTAFGLAASAHAAVLFTDGHGDLGIGYVANELEPHVHIEGGTVGGTFYPDQEFEADEVEIRVPASSFFYSWGPMGGRPNGTQWDPIGVAAGMPFYFLPATDTGPGGSDDLQSPFLGLGSEELDPGDWVGDLEIALYSVTGPGNVSIWNNGFFGPTFVASTTDGLDGADAFAHTPGGHSHYNWGFSQPGTYQVALQISGTHGLDGAKSAIGVYTFQVQGAVPEPGTFGLAVLGGLVLRRLRRTSGVTADEPVRARRHRSRSRLGF
jgi:surface-anchored protein